MRGTARQLFYRRDYFGHPLGYVRAPAVVKGLGYQQAPPHIVGAGQTSAAVAPRWQNYGD